MTILSGVTLGELTKLSGSLKERAHYTRVTASGPASAEAPVKSSSVGSNAPPLPSPSPPPPGKHPQRGPPAPARRVIENMHSYRDRSTTYLKLSVGVTSHPYLLETEVLFTLGWRTGPTVGESVGGIVEMDSSDLSSGIRYHTFDTRPDTEFKGEFSCRRAEDEDEEEIQRRSSDCCQYPPLPGPPLTPSGCVAHR
jgi:hypothetical protein